MKNIIKDDVLSKRNSLSREDILSKSSKIKEYLFDLNEYKNSNVIMFFVSIKNEVHTHDMIKESLKSKIIVVPKILSDGINPSIILDFDQLIPGKFNILEPIEVASINLKSIKMVLVPGIVFDRQGHRIGHGYGYYDKFLSKVSNAVKIGLAFDFQVVDKIPEEIHDVSVDLVITDKEVIKVKN